MIYISYIDPTEWYTCVLNMHHKHLISLQEWIQAMNY